MFEGWPYLLSGTVLGLAGGFLPGPITTLVIVQSVRYGSREGMKIALAPVITDAPVALVALFIIDQLENADRVLGVIALLGAGFLSYLAYDSFRAHGLAVDADASEPQSLQKGAIANLLNPNPYLFWFTIGAPTVLEAFGRSGLFVGLFLSGLYVSLVGTKICFAVLAGRGRSLLSGTSYAYTVRILGIALFVFALKFVRDGLTYLEVLN